MSLLAEASPPLKMPRKRLFEEVDYQSPNTLPSEHSNVHCAREFPRFYGPSFSNGQRENHDFSRKKTTKASGIAIEAVVIAAKPLRMIKAKDNMQKPNTFLGGNVLKDGKASYEQIEVPSMPEFDWVEEEEISIISPSEWNLMKSGFKRQDTSKKDFAIGSLVEQKGEHSEEHSDEEPETVDAKNLWVVPYDVCMAVVNRNKVQDVLKQYEELYTQLLKEYEPEFKQKGRVTKQIHTRAATILKNQKKWVNFEQIIGHVPGVEVGDQFQFRAELVLVGLHHQYMSGINWVTLNGKKYANSIVDSGRYENKTTAPNAFVYSGQGGIHKALTEKADQKLVGGNLALKNSMDANYPVRVIRKTLIGANTGNASDKKMYIYEGLYTVKKVCQERDQNGKLAFMFQMVKMSGEIDFDHPMTESSAGHLENSIDVEYDVSQGKEKIPIRLVNVISNEKPLPFSYITSINYPDWCQISLPNVCNCINGCSDSERCCCAIKNGGEIPFNEEGSIIRPKSFIYECGPSCKCPPSCQNRVSQLGPQFQLEVFKTESTGWGVRSPQIIPSGSFICEYIGQLLQDKEAEQRINNDEYLFDLDDKNCFTVDAATYGNVGRFINHSCSPNLYAQNVLYDHHDKRLPHIMLFAVKKIPAFEELTYDYNYKIESVRDADGNIKRKTCHCGSRKCTGRLY